MQPRLGHILDSKGQTLIETLAAIFILVMGITSAVGLAVYAFGSSTTVTKQIIATGLAREGLEAVKNMRDTNWLAQTSIDTDCYSFASSTEMNADCYTHWLDDSGLSVPYCINPSSNPAACDGGIASSTYALGFDSNTINAPNFWILLPQTGSLSPKYGLNFNPANSGTTGFYSPGASGVSCVNGTADYCRKITITKLTSAPYNQATTGPLVEVQSQVWWLDKKCPKVNDWPGLGKCSVELDTYLTNWKNY